MNYELSIQRSIAEKIELARLEREPASKPPILRETDAPNPLSVEDFRIDTHPVSDFPLIWSAPGLKTSANIADNEISCSLDI